MNDLSVEFENLHLLDSPLLPTLAPELVPIRDLVLEAMKSGSASGCTSCQKRAVITKLAELHAQMQELIDGSPDLQQVLPQLLTSAKVQK